MTSVVIPVLSRSPRRRLNRALRDRFSGSRVYDDEPLPFKPSNLAPRQATIVGRIIDDGIASYNLQIGDVVIPNVTPSEVLDYVSPCDLEQFENQQFEEERHLLQIVEAEAEIEKEEARQRTKERAKRKGTVLFQERSSGPGTDDAETSDVLTGRHGRARPSYKHLYHVNKDRRRRRRDPETGELLSLSDEETGDAVSANLSAHEASARAGSDRTATQHIKGLPRRRRRKRDKVTGELLPLSPGPARDSQTPSVSETSEDEAHDSNFREVLLAENPKRRRRKRDKVTGELLPLSPIRVAQSDRWTPVGDASKRPRRRRHPITKELMPLGWRYDPQAEESLATVEFSNDTTMPDMGEINSTGRGHDSKRLKVVLYDEESEEYESSKATQLVKGTDSDKELQKFLRARSTRQTPDHTEDEAILIATSSGEDTSFARHSKNKLQAKTSSLMMKPDTLASSLTSQPIESRTRTPLHSQHKPQQRSRSMQSDYSQSVQAGGSTFRADMAPALSSTKLSNVRKAAADPSTTRHQGHGKSSTIHTMRKTSIINPIILSDEESFDASKHETGRSSRSNLELQARGTEVDQHPSSGEEDILDEGEFFVEAILKHNLSDPRTHRSDMGAKPVMLYLTKWQGFDELTWEPEESFVDPGIVLEYRSRAGLI